MAPDRSGFGNDTTTEQVLEGVSLEGRVAIVTGSSGGLGLETARALASRGCAVTLTARDLGKGQGALETIRASHPEARLELRELELCDPESVRSFATDWQEDHGKLHLLILNAGVMACPQARTPQGWELQFATNHLGHFLLASELVEPLLAGAPSRVISLSSSGHAVSPVIFDDVHFEQREYDPWAAYGQSKTANVLFALDLDRRFRERGVRAFAVHPGIILTDLGRHLTPEMIKDIMERASDAGEGFKPVEAGAATSVWAATAPELDGRGGLYLSNCRIAPKLGEGDAGYAPHAVDPAAAEQLWEVSEKTLGVSFR